MDAADALLWHEWWRDAWTEQRPIPAEMTKNEAFQWIAEHSDGVIWHPGNDMYPGQWEVVCPDIPRKVRAKTLLEAVGLAAAYFDEV